jgi:hypothetical protein
MGMVDGVRWEVWGALVGGERPGRSGWSAGEERFKTCLVLSSGGSVDRFREWLGI